MKEFLKANKGCVLAIALISPVVVVFFEYIFYYHIQYRTENVKCVYDIIGAGMQTCLLPVRNYYPADTVKAGMAENVCKAYKDYFGGFRIFNSADLSDTVLFYGCYMELECADKLCVYLRRRGYGISSVCDTGGGRLLYGGVYGINDCVCIDVIFLVGL